jgi:hypothetical protein
MRYPIQVLQCSGDHLLCWVKKMHPKTDEHMSVNLKIRTSGCAWQWLEEEDAFASTQLQYALDARF